MSRTTLEASVSPLTAARVLCWRITQTQIAFVLSYRVLVRRDGLAVEVVEVGRDDLDEVCSEKALDAPGMRPYIGTYSRLVLAWAQANDSERLTLLGMRPDALKGVFDAQLLPRLQLLWQAGSLDVGRDVCAKAELVDDVAKVVVVLVFEVRHLR